MLLGTSEDTHNMTPNTRLHAPHRTPHPAPAAPPPPRLGGKDMYEEMGQRRWKGVVAAPATLGVCLGRP